MNKEEVLEHVQKLYGEESIFSLDGYVKKPIDVISTGSFSLDNFVLGKGGIPRGRATMVVGKPSSGKTTVSLQTAAKAQESGLLVAFIDAEHAIDFDYAANLGVDVEELMVSQPETLPKAFEVVDTLCKLGSVGLIIFDSIVALGSGDEYDAKKFEDVKAEYGKRALMNNVFLRRVLPSIKKHNVALLIVNQLRDNLNTGGGGFNVKQYTIPGGRGLQHYVSIILELIYTGQIKQGDEIIGQKVKAFTSKNKVSGSLRSTVVEMYTGRGIDPIGDLLLVGSDLGVIGKRGSWYVYNDETIGQGRLKTIEALNSDKELLDMIIQETQEKWQNEQ